MSAARASLVFLGSGHLVCDMGTTCASGTVHHTGARALIQAGFSTRTMTAPAIMGEILTCSPESPAADMRVRPEETDDAEKQVWRGADYWRPA